ncbi:type II toxin-antitoxin system RelE/ParE family toxin [Aliirhizobium terrae]|uniref:type II toxin-antitoxin system RelE/ParE family toxin n=1 Tax=Terrirhizobium terrae TaxID=2926709 RepID=UPI002575E32E|nr:type II toxin-antitoxin system RelE/ParE family toxin [Rhizobium sp. CC-CFT758]WJH39408.1 type II toxin-antitoxin system RelE/ParE family toxin [Rhizobium sp. CC-CFT758]
MRVRLSKNAGLFLKSERDYLEHFNPRAAEAVLRQLRAALRLLKDYPQAGSPHAALDGRRRFVSGDYVIDYRIRGSMLEVSHIRHGRQLPPDPDDDKDIGE